MPILNVVSLSRLLNEDRFSAEFFDPSFELHAKDEAEWTTVGSVLTEAKYGFSVAMNEDGDGVPILRMTELRETLVKSAAKWAPIEPDLCTEYWVKPGDVLFNRTNAYDQVGRTGYVTQEMGAVFASYLIRLRVRPGAYAPATLAFYLNSPTGSRLVRRRAMRSINQANVSASQLRRVPLPRFSREIDEAAEQAVVEASEKLVRAEEALAQAVEVLESWQAELPIPSKAFSTVQSQLLRSQGRWDAEYFSPAARRQDIELDGKPTVRFTSLADVLKPAAAPRETPEAEFTYIELADIDSRTGTAHGAHSWIAEDLPGRARREVLEGDVIASSVLGSVDKVALIGSAENGAIASTGFLHTRPRTVSSEFLLALVKSRWVRDRILRHGSGGILSAVPDSLLKNLLVPDFPDEIVARVSALVVESQQAAVDGRAVLTDFAQRLEQIMQGMLSR